MGLILVDSSVWIDHIRSPIGRLDTYLGGERVLQHPFVTGEIALGSMANRATIIGMLALLPQAAVSDPATFLAFVGEHEIFGTGLGLVDVHLLICATAQSAEVWSSDKRLARQAERLGLAHQPD